MIAAYLIQIPLQACFSIEVQNPGARVIFDLFAITFHVPIRSFALLPELGGISIRIGALEAILVLRHDDLVATYQQRALRQNHIADEGAYSLCIVHYHLIGLQMHRFVAVSAGGKTGWRPKLQKNRQQESCQQ